MNNKVGNLLRQTRQEKSISLEDASSHTFIKKHYLQALEEGNFGELPSAIQVRGFLKSYADYLGLDGDELLNSLKENPSAVTEEQDHLEEDLDQPIVLRQITTQTIFDEIGSTIRVRREALGLSLDNVEEHTHIPFHYIQIIEEGKLEEFPSPAQARGMLTNYVSFLDMDIDSVLLRYAEALQASISSNIPTPQHEHNESVEAIPSPQKNKIEIPQSIKRLLSADVLVFSFIGVGLILFIIWGIGKIISTPTATLPNQTSLPADSVLTNSPTLPSTETVATTPEINTVSSDENSDFDQTQTNTATLPPFGQEAIQIFIVVRQRTFLRVTVDGEIEFEGRAVPGSNLPFAGRQRIEILTGNGAALQIYFNDQDLGPLGIFGEVINVIYTQNGPATPTITITTTPRLQDLPTETPTPSQATPSSNN